VARSKVQLSGHFKGLSWWSGSILNKLKWLKSRESRAWWPIVMILRGWKVGGGGGSIVAEWHNGWRTDRRTDRQTFAILESLLRLKSGGHVVIKIQVQSKKKIICVHCNPYWCIEGIFSKKLWILWKPLLESNFFSCST